MLQKLERKLSFYTSKNYMLKRSHKFIFSTHYKKLQNNGLEKTSLVMSLSVRVTKIRQTKDSLRLNLFQLYFVLHKIH